MDRADRPTLRDGDLLLRALTPPAGAPEAEQAPVVFAIEWAGELAGNVELRISGPGIGVLAVHVHEPFRHRRVGSRAARLAVDHGFADLGLTRIEAFVERHNRSGLGVALRAGLRREGVLRGRAHLEGQAHDTVVVGRLRDDPAPGTREGFTAMLDTVLPVTRAIAQGLLRNEDGDVLLCELMYKREWDLPGGVVDPSESPAACVVREVREELGLDVQVQGLLAVDWLPPWLGWRDAILLVFDLGTVPSSTRDQMVLEAHEVRAVHWAPEHLWESQVAPYTARLLRSIDHRPHPSAEHGAVGGPVGARGAVYLEDGRPHFG